MMCITKTSLRRRTFLRGVGATLALPFLDAMAPALTAASRVATGAKHRMGFFYTPSGIPLSLFTPREEGKLGEELTPVLAPFASVKDHLVVVSGLSNVPAEDPLISTGPHTRCGAAWLNGVRPKRTEGADIEAGITIDQHAAVKLGQDTPLRSLELALDNNTAVGNCDVGYSCAYVNTYSWRTPTTPNPMETNPRRVFERLFGDGGTPSEQRRQLRRDASILDLVRSSLASLQKRLGPSDRRLVDGHLQGIRDVEQRIQKAEQFSVRSPLAAADPPFGIPDNYDEHVRLMLDLQFLAYQADITRVATVQLNREQSGQSYPWIGVPEANHDCSHHGGKPVRMAHFAKISTYHGSLVAALAEKMRDTPDGDGSLLDHSVLLFGSGMGDGNLHSPHDLPVVLVGGMCGQLEGGRHLRYALDTPFMNLGLTLLDKVGVELEQLGDGTGRLAGV